MAWREVHQDVGDFTVSLDERLPLTIRPDVDGAFGGFSLCVILPGRVPHRAVTPAGLLAIARDSGGYTGLIRGVKYAGGEVEVYGVSPLALSGDEDSKGDDPIDTSGGGTITTHPFWNGVGNTSVVEAWRTRAQGLTVHASVPTAASPTGSYAVDEGATGLDILRRGCRGPLTPWREFYLDQALALHADTAANLFTSGHAVITPEADGPDGDRWAIPARPAPDSDLEDYTTRVKVNNGPSISGEVAVGSTPYYAPDGDPVELQRTIQSNAPPSNGAAANVATNQLGRFDAPANTITVRTAARGVRAHLMPGDWPWLFDPDAGLYDLAEQETFAGRTIAPVVGVRCEALRVNIDERSGVYLVWHDGEAQHVVDWSDFLVPEAPGADIEIGHIKRTLGYEPLAKAAA